MRAPIFFAVSLAHFAVIALLVWFLLLPSSPASLAKIFPRHSITPPAPAQDPSFLSKLLQSAASPQHLAKTAAQGSQPVSLWRKPAPRFTSPAKPSPASIQRTPPHPPKTDIRRKARKLVSRKTLAAKTELAQIATPQEEEPVTSLSQNPDEPPSPNRNAALQDTVLSKSSVGDAALKKATRPILPAPILSNEEDYLPVAALEMEQSEEALSAAAVSLPSTAPTEEGSSILDSIAARPSPAVPPSQAKQVSQISPGGQNTSAVQSTNRTEDDRKLRWKFEWPTGKQRRLISSPPLQFPLQMLQDLEDQSVEVIFQVDISGKVVSVSFAAQPLQAYNWQINTLLLEKVKYFQFESLETSRPLRLDKGRIKFHFSRAKEITGSKLQRPQASETDQVADLLEGEL